MKTKGTNTVSTESAKLLVERYLKSEGDNPQPTTEQIDKTLEAGADAYGSQDAFIQVLKKHFGV
jgi:hypothetical protein